MNLDIHEQIFESINRAKKVLVALPENLTPDSVSSGLALALFLERMEKKVEIVSSGQIPENLKFLPKIEKIKNRLRGGRSFVISVNTSLKELSEISYQKEEKRVDIFLKPKNEMFSKEDIILKTDKFPIDLIIAVDSRSQESFGKLFEENTDLFFEVPKINIDNHSGNEYHGSINLVDVAASSVAEVVSELLEKFEEEIVDEDIATCLLAGIITKTNSFQHVLTTPKSFSKASKLVSLGGRQQEVIKHLYKTKPLNFLKLWGRALSKLKIKDDLGVVYSTLEAQDFKDTETSTADSEKVLKELLENMGSFKIIGLITEVAEEGASILLALHSQIKPEDILQKLDGDGKVLDINLGNFNFINAVFEGISIKEAETKLLKAVIA